MNRREALTAMGSPLVGIPPKEENNIYGYIVKWDLYDKVYDELIPAGESIPFKTQKTLFNYDNEKAIRTDGRYPFSYTKQQVDAKKEAENFANTLKYYNHQAVNVRIIELHAKIL